MSKLTEEERANLEDELFWCRENLKILNRKKNQLIDKANDLDLEISIWQERFQKADRKYAFATKLTICGKGQIKKEGVIKALEKILEDKDKLKSFIKLLEDEGGDLSAI